MITEHGYYQKNPDPTYGFYYIHFDVPEYDLSQELMHWCNDNFGEPGFVGARFRWQNYIRLGAVHFKSEEDVNWFILRWSNRE